MPGTTRSRARVHVRRRRSSGSFKCAPLWIFPDSTSLSNGVDKQRERKNSFYSSPPSLCRHFFSIVPRERIEDFEVSRTRGRLLNYCSKMYRERILLKRSVYLVRQTVKETSEGSWRQSKNQLRSNFIVMRVIWSDYVLRSRRSRRIAGTFAGALKYRAAISRRTTNRAKLIRSGEVTLRAHGYRD